MYIISLILYYNNIENNTFCSEKLALTEDFERFCPNERF